MYATPEELKTFLRRPDLADDDPGLTLCLRGATGAIEAYCGQPIGNITDTVTLLGGSPILMLPTFPVADVDSVTEDGTVLEDGTDYQWTQDGILNRLAGRTWGTRVEVAYTFGPGAVPDGVKLVCLSLAGRYWDNPTNEQIEGFGGFQVTHAMAGRAHDLSEGEKGILDPFRKEAG